MMEVLVNTIIDFFQSILTSVKDFVGGWSFLFTSEWLFYILLTFNTPAEMYDLRNLSVDLYEFIKPHEYRYFH